MVGTEFVPLDGGAIFWVVLTVTIVIMIPGFLLSLALFPKRKAMAMSERLAMSFGLGLAAPFLLTMLNIAVGLNVNFVTSLIVFVVMCALGILGFLYKGGTLNLLEWYNSKE